MIVYQKDQENRDLLLSMSTECALIGDWLNRCLEDLNKKKY